VLALVDTLRADHLGVYGYARPTSPHIDAFARAGVQFVNARSQAPCTYPSANSLLTSRYPTRFEGRGEGRMGIPPGVPALAEILQEHGFRTYAVSASPIVRKTPSHFNKEGRFDQGHEVFDESCFWKDASCVNARAFELLDASEGQVFLYLHYMDPHDPYQPPPTHPRRFALGRPAQDFIERGNPNPIAEMIYAQGAPKVEVTEADRQHLIDLYDEEIRYFDGHFQALLDGLDHRGLLADALVVLLSDHGEAFLERGDAKHCRHLHDTQIRTPLVLGVPGLARGRRIETPVENVDVAPTILDYLALPPDPGFEGGSLRPLIEGRADGSATGFAAWRTQRSAFDARHKLIVDPRAGEAALYDLERDPAEEHDVIDEHADVAARLREALRAHRKRVEADRPAATDTEEQLRALGYLE
jgi:arylsulfatase A-like enzyme